MWADRRIRIKLDAQPRAVYFRDTFDKHRRLALHAAVGVAPLPTAETTLTPVLRNRQPGGIGDYNYGSDGT